MVLAQRQHLLSCVCFQPPSSFSLSVVLSSILHPTKPHFWQVFSIFMSLPWCITRGRDTPLCIQPCLWSGPFVIRCLALSLRQSTSHLHIPVGEIEIKRDDVLPVCGYS